MKVLLGILIVLLTHSTALALPLSIDIFNLHTQQNQVDQWMSSLGGQSQVLEDFESTGSGWHQSLSTNVGQFHINDETLAGTGGSSYTKKTGNKQAHFELRDYNAHGRYNTTTGGTNYIDSADITSLSLTLDKKVNNLFFYMSDPNDGGALMNISSGGTSTEFGSSQKNGSLWFVGIKADTYLTDILWSTNRYTADGFGLDHFGTVTAAPVPEPTTVALLALGLLTTVWYRRRQLA